MRAEEEGTAAMKTIEVQHHESIVGGVTVRLTHAAGKGWFCHVPTDYVLGSKTYFGHRVAGPFPTKTGASNRAKEILKKKVEF